MKAKLTIKYSNLNSKIQIHPVFDSLSVCLCVCLCVFVSFHSWWKRHTESTYAYRWLFDHGVHWVEVAKWFIFIYIQIMYALPILHKTTSVFVSILCSIPWAALIQTKYILKYNLKAAYVRLDYTAATRCTHSLLWYLPLSLLPIVSCGACWYLANVNVYRLTCY